MELFIRSDNLSASKYLYPNIWANNQATLDDLVKLQIGKFQNELFLRSHKFS